MKNLRKDLIIGLGCITLLCSSFIFCGLPAIEHSHADVNALENILIFTDCKPLNEFETIGNVKVGFSVSGSYQEIISKLVKKARKDYPTAQGIIFDGNDKAQVIKFK